MNNDTLVTDFLLLSSARLALRTATIETLTAELEGGPGPLSRALAADVSAWPPLLHDEDSMRWSLRALENLSRPTGWNQWYFMLRGSPRPTLVGVGGIRRAKPVDDFAEVGYSVLPAFQRRGIAVEAVQMLIAWAREQPGIRSVIAYTYPDLTPSIRVLERSGFQPDGPGTEAGTIRYRHTLPARGKARSSTRRRR